MDDIESKLKEEEETSLYVYVTGFPTSASIVLIMKQNKLKQNDITSIFAQCGEVQNVKMTVSEAEIKYKYHGSGILVFVYIQLKLL